MQSIRQDRKAATFATTFANATVLEEGYGCWEKPETGNYKFRNLKR